MIFAATGADIAVGLASIFVIGIACQWAAERMHIPSIVLLLAAGVLAGPVTGLIDPTEIFGDLLLPAVSLAVGILLFEGGLGLRFDKLPPEARGPVLRLISVGVLVTGLVGAAVALAVLDVSTEVALLIGAVLSVSGPTVIMPLLRIARPREPSASILRWEGIFIDPVGATLAIVVLDAIIEERDPAGSFLRIVTTFGSGAAAGLLAAFALMEVLRRHWVPDHLQNPVTLLFFVLGYAGANLIRPEAGLLAATVMGFVLANQRRAAIGHIKEFEENLGTVLLSGLFIVLGARVPVEDLADAALPGLAIAAGIAFVGRPLAVAASTVGSKLDWRARAYISAVSPRGIVAAAVASLFALELAEEGIEVPNLVPVTFVVIAATVVLSGLTAAPMARALRLARAEPSGLALIGAPSWVLELAEELSKEGVPVLVVTTDEREVDDATGKGFLVYTGRLDSEDLDEAIDAVGVARAIATSRADELNAYGISRLVATLGRANLYHLPPEDPDQDRPADASVIGRKPFFRKATQQSIEEAVADGARFETVDADGFDDARHRDALLLLTVNRSGPPVINFEDDPSPPTNGQRAILLLDGGRTRAEAETP